MTRLIIGMLLIVVVLSGAYLALSDSNQASEPRADVATEAAIREALQSAPLDVSEYGGGTVMLNGGEALFGTAGATGTPQGFVGMSDTHAALFKGQDADVYAVVNVSGGGTGAFAYLVHYEYAGASGVLTEVEKVLLGDRIIVDSVVTNQDEPTSYDVLVHLKERLIGEAMATVPAHDRVLHFSRDTGKLVLTDVTYGTIDNPQVVVTSPLPGAPVAKAFTVTGAARGGWYFEGSLPVSVKNLSGDTLVTLPATAQGEWMTDALVPFAISFTLPVSATGIHAVLIQKDNPSGLPENDAMIEIPIVVQ